MDCFPKQIKFWSAFCYQVKNVTFGEHNWVFKLLLWKLPKTDFTFKPLLAKMIIYWLGHMPVFIIQVSWINTCHIKMLVTKLISLSVNSYYSNPLIHMYPRMHKPSYVVKFKDYLLLHSEHAPTLFTFISRIERMRSRTHFLVLKPSTWDVSP
jgi:hypothetical protein